MPRGALWNSRRAQSQRSNLSTDGVSKRRTSSPQTSGGGEWSGGDGSPLDDDDGGSSSGRLQEPLSGSPDEEAEDFQQAVALRACQIATARALCDLAHVKARQGVDGEAESHARRALQIYGALSSSLCRHY